MAGVALRVLRDCGPGKEEKARQENQSHHQPPLPSLSGENAAESLRMKVSLKPGLSFSKKITVDEVRCIGFMGKEGMVYATPRMVSDVEYTCRDFLLQHLDPGEDSVGG